MSFKWAKERIKAFFLEVNNIFPNVAGDNERLFSVYELNFL